MMIDTAPLRAALLAAQGQPLEVLPEDMARMLDAIDTGNTAQRQVKFDTAIAKMIPAGRA